MSIIDIINSKDIVDYIDGLELHPDGSYRKRCSIHQGKNPTSFTVFPDTNSYHCWSCDSGGSIINYVMETEGLGFSSAVEILCDHYNINIKSDEKYTKQKSIAEKNEYQCQRYEQNLPDIQDYLMKKRGFSKDIIKLYRFGFDKKESRLIIPLIDRYGRIVSFTARYFNTEPKYKHGYNNEIFQKSTYWFNLINARKLIKKKGRVWLVEGHLDCASAQQQEEPALGYLGIVMSKEQLLSLKQLLIHLEGIEVILVPDADGKASEHIPKVRQMFMKHWPTANLRVALMGGE